MSYLKVGQGAGRPGSGVKQYCAGHGRQPPGRCAAYSCVGRRPGSRPGARSYIAQGTGPVAAGPLLGEHTSKVLCVWLKHRTASVSLPAGQGLAGGKEGAPLGGLPAAALPGTAHQPARQRRSRAWRGVVTVPGTSAVWRCGRGLRPLQPSPPGRRQGCRVGLSRAHRPDHGPPRAQPLLLLASAANSLQRRCPAGRRFPLTHLASYCSGHACSACSPPGWQRPAPC